MSWNPSITPVVGVVMLCTVLASFVCFRVSELEPAQRIPVHFVRVFGAASLLLDACVEGALLNVGINLSSIDDAAFVAEMQRETAILQEESQRLRSQVLALVRKRF